jgi:hypothetical protein
MTKLTWQSAQPDQASQDCNKTPLTEYTQWSMACTKPKILSAYKALTWQLQLTFQQWQLRFKLPLLRKLSLNKHQKIQQRKTECLAYIPSADKPIGSPFSSPLDL